MAKSIGVSDEMYDKLAKLATDADTSLMQLLDTLLQHVVVRARIVTKTELEISDNYADIATPQQTTPQPLHRSGFQKGVRQGSRTGSRTGMVDRVSELLANATKPLTAVEVRDLLGLKAAPAILYISPRFQAYDTQPRTFSLKRA